MGWLWLVGSIKLQVSFAKEPYVGDHILQKRHMVLSILLTVATPYRRAVNSGTGKIRITRISHLYSLFPTGKSVASAH